MPLLAINHHYYRSVSTGRGIYPTTPEALREEVSKIRAAGWRIGSQSDLHAFIDGLLPPEEKLAILTFDDGLKEQMSALADLDAMGAAAICFAPTEPLTTPRVLDVHKLHMIRAEVPDQLLAEELRTCFAFESYAFDDQLLAIQYRYDDAIGRRVKYFLNFVLDEADRIAWTADFFVKLFGDEVTVANTLYLNQDEIRQIANRGLLGSHAHAHLPLATLSEQRMASELQQSKQILQVLGAHPVTGISYPFGGESAVSQKVFETASALGYRYGFTMKRGINSSQQPPFCLKRIDVNDVDTWLVQT